MGTVYNRKNFGLYTNGCGQLGDNTNFTDYTAEATNVNSNGSSFAVTTNIYGTTSLGGEFVPVDTSKTYQHSVMAYGVANNYLGNPPGGHLGFACYDESFNFIDLRNCKDIGDCQLTRAATPGVDTVLYVDDASGWSVADPASTYRNLMLFAGSTYTYAGGYTRYTTYQAYGTSAIADIGGGEWTITLSSPLTDFGDTTGGDYPVGTWLANGRAGGTYNYCHSNPNHTLSTWTTYTTAAFTGESRNSSTPFRYGTKYIKWLNLRNYNTRTQTGGDSPRYALDNIMLVECPNGTAWPDALFTRTNTL